ncbi:MAG: HNH endonuclease signature motif containing protein [Flavobacterium sp.]|uniref:HNH endonuclease signature motif containing protein n=1 Tax=Flavobacterium sp. TaxID=239 RepID=UPI002B49DA4E|nr:HNH endonuclease signature motif containing protein [Flavobacterium sp.]WRH73957.1 MAG: HNH endonuclease signature motif containing protein [Flavobacterium sp.]
MAIRTIVKRKLWASSGGFCGKPDCHADLFPFFESGEITNIEELAHIIGQKKKGPRGANPLPLSERDEFENIILLCPTCHTIIDKNPKLYPDNTIKQWKANHENSISNIFKVPKLESRLDASKYLKPLLAENKAIFDLYGPHSKNAIDNQLATELMWEKLAIQKILPNNRKIEAFIEQNQDLFEGNEFGLFIEYKLHREGFEYNKISGDVNSTVPTFPNGFENIFK